MSIGSNYLKSWLAILLWQSISIFPSFAASAYIPIKSNVYKFLNNCAVKGIIPISTTTNKPIPIEELCGLLLTISEKSNQLNDKILISDLEYYLREYAHELKWHYDSFDGGKTQLKLDNFNNNPLESPHKRMLVIEDEYSLIFDFVGNVKTDFSSRETIYRRASGIRFNGEINQNIGYFFQFIDYVEKGGGPYLERSDLLLDEYGYVGPLLGGEETYYDQTEAYLTTKWKKLRLIFGKDLIAWGPGEENLLFSGNSPSYTQFRLEYNLSRKTRFNFIIGKLNPFSAPFDTIYQTEAGWTRINAVQKWVTGHRLEYDFTPWLTLSVSEALVWGDRDIDFSYLNPLIFLYSAEHDNGDHDNVLLSGDFKIKVSDKGFFYGALLIDDMNTSTIGEGSAGNKFGYDAGFNLLNTGIDGLSALITYQRLDPFTYSHFFPVNRFSTWTSNLGSTLKPNSDKIGLLISYRPFRELEFKSRVERYRHGTTGGDIAQAVPRNFSEKAYLLSGSSSAEVEAEISFDWEFFPGAVFSASRIFSFHTSALEDRFFLGLSYRD